MNKMTKITITAGLALALTVGFGTTAKSAWAGYLGTQNVVPYNTADSSHVLYSSSSTPSFFQSYTNNSSFGDTIPNPLPGSGITGFTASVNPNNPNNNALPYDQTFYNSSTLDLQKVNSMLSSYTATGGTGSFSGDLLSQVFKVGSATTMAGSHPGELVFTYQFDVLHASAQQGANQISLAFLNNPSGNGSLYGSWLLGGGFNSSNGLPTGYKAIGTDLATSSGLTTSQNIFSGLTGAATVTNGTISSESDQWSNAMGVGTLSPQIFLATNAYSYTLGSFSAEGNGISGSTATFVPGTPEPSTLVLLGSGLALLAFMALRKRENGLTI